MARVNTPLDFALGLALLYHAGADSKAIRNYAKRFKKDAEEQCLPLVQLCLDATDRVAFVRGFLENL